MSSLTILLVALGVTFALLVAGGIAGRTKKDNLEGWLVDHRNDRPGSQHDRICGSKPGDLCLPRCNDTTIIHDTEGDRSGNG